MTKSPTPTENPKKQRDNPKRFRSVKESSTQPSENSNEVNNDIWNNRTLGTLLQRSTLQLGISVDKFINKHRYRDQGQKPSQMES